jgi:hypothetical protein
MLVLEEHCILLGKNNSVLWLVGCPEFETGLAKFRSEFHNYSGA